MQTSNLNILKPYLNGPLPLTPDNFTPVLRTPWGGKYITTHLKNAMCPERVGDIVGESWDFSCEPSFPSKILGSSITLSDLIAEFPKELLSEAYIREKGENCEILVKVLNAAQDLSLQVHPSDDDPFLKSDECGKFESWFVLHAEEGAGIYLGFKQGLKKADLADSLKQGKDLRPLLNFIAVKAGDYFEIPMGICHAIGKGVVVFEPQHVLAAKKAKTYRIYDWGRTYNSQGELDPNGKARELHIREGMALIDPETQSGEVFLNFLRGATNSLTLEEGLVVESYGHSAFYKFHRIHIRKQQILAMNLEGGFGALIPVQGSFALRPHGGVDTYWQKGQPGFLGASSFPLRIEALADSIMFIITPEIAKESWQRGIGDLP